MGAQLTVDSVEVRGNRAVEGGGLMVPRQAVIHAVVCLGGGSLNGAYLQMGDSAGLLGSRSTRSHVVDERSPPPSRQITCILHQVFGDATLHVLRSDLQNNKAVSGGNDLQLDLKFSNPVLVNTTFAQAQYGLKTPVQCHSMPCSAGQSCAAMPLGGVVCVPCGMQQLGTIARQLVGKGGGLGSRTKLWLRRSVSWSGLGSTRPCKYVTS